MAYLTMPYNFTANVDVVAAATTNANNSAIVNALSDGTTDIRVNTATVSALNVLGSAAFGGSVVYSAGVQYDSSVSFAGTATYAGAAVYDGSMQANSSVSFAQTATYSGAVNFVSATGINFGAQNLSTTGTISAGGATFTSGIINGTLTVNGDGANAGLSVSSANLVTIGASGGTQSHTANGSIFQLVSASGVTASLNVAPTGGNASAILRLIRPDAATTGDPYIRLGNASGSDDWSLGSDTSNSSVFALARGTGLSSTNYFQMSTAGAATIGASGGTQTHAVNGGLTVTRNAFFGSSLSSATMVGAAGGSILTSTSQTGFEVVGTHGNSSATTAIYGFRANMSTTNASYTTGILAHFNHSQASIGASHTVTREIAFRVGAKGTGGTVSNFAALADNSSFTGDWFIHSTSTNPSLFGGNIGVGGQSPTTVYGIVSSMSGAALTGADIVGVGSINSAASTATSGATALYTGVTTSNNSFTCARLIQLWLDNNAKGAASTITRRVGALIEQPTDGTNNAALVLGQATLNFTGTWNVYSDSTQPSRFGGGSFIVGSAALSTSATDGFLYIPTCAGTPTGVPTAQTGTVAMVFDTTNNRFYIYDGGWISVALA